MTLYNYLELMPEGEELIAWDVDYDMEIYFYGGKPDNTWSEAITELSKLLTITEIRSSGVIVNLSEIIESKLDNLDKAELFIRCDIDSIMDDISNILSGNVSETWMQKFVVALK